MSYYTMPKNNTIINVSPLQDDYENTNPYVSQSLYNYYNKCRNEIENTFLNNADLSDNFFDELIKIVNPCEYIFSVVPGFNVPVCKLKPKTNLFYDFLEVSTITNIFESFKNKNVKTLHFTPNNNDTIECFKMLREKYNDENVYYDEINEDNMRMIENTKFDFLFIEVDLNNFKNYIRNLIECLMLIYKNQDCHGMCIIKINHIFHKPAVDTLYILSSLYEKVLVFKPTTSNIISFDKYIVCKKFKKIQDDNLEHKCNYYKLLVFLKKILDKNIVSILDYDIPNYFLSKIDDLNNTIGQQQLESLDLIINLLKNKNKEEKIQTIKKCNIQKSIAWCEKYKMPFNRFSEKINIFLPTNTEIK